MRWADVCLGRSEDPQCCDDIYLKQICLEKDWACYNSLVDHAQHTGMGERSFDDAKAESSNYQSLMFVGEVPPATT